MATGQCTPFLLAFQVYPGPPQPWASDLHGALVDSDQGTDPWGPVSAHFWQQVTGLVPERRALAPGLQSLLDLPLLHTLA